MLQKHWFGGFMKANSNSVIGVKNYCPAVSVVVVTNQIDGSLIELLEKLRVQKTSKNYETIVVSEVPVPAEDLVLFDGCRIVKIPSGKGVAFNRNMGVKNARGKFITFIDSDCVPKEDWLENLLDSIGDDVHVATGGTMVPDSNFIGTSISALGFPGGGSVGFDKMWHVSSNGFTDHLATGNVVIKRRVFDEVGLFDESLKHGAEDAELSVRLTRAGVKIKYCPDATVLHTPRASLLTFIRWQFKRGRANYHFRKKVGSVSKFISLRLWSSKNILRENIRKKHFPLVLVLLSASFLLQQAGYMWESISMKVFPYARRLAK